MADDKKSPEYAMLPAGTICKWGPPGADVATMKPLVNCKAVGTLGQTAGFVDCTTLIDLSKQSLSDLPDGQEKNYGFIDDPTNENFAAFLNAAENKETVQFYTELPNGRTSMASVALAGWEIAEIAAPANEVIQISVKGKQNSNKWGVVPKP